jgi:hypothetical protein
MLPSDRFESDAKMQKQFGQSSRICTYELAAGEARVGRDFRDDPLWRDEHVQGGIIIELAFRQDQAGERRGEYINAKGWDAVSRFA